MPNVSQWKVTESKRPKNGYESLTFLTSILIVKKSQWSNWRPYQDEKEISKPKNTTDDCFIYVVWCGRNCSRRIISAVQHLIPTFTYGVNFLSLIFNLDNRFYAFSVAFSLSRHQLFKEVEHAALVVERTMGCSSRRCLEILRRMG